MAQDSSYELLVQGAETSDTYRLKHEVATRLADAIPIPDAVEDHLINDEMHKPVAVGTFASVADTMQQHPGRNIFHNWWAELSALGLSIVAFIAIIVTLRPHDGQPLPQWPYSISVNALISVYVVAFKAATLYIVAEALGQLKWLWYRQPHPLQHIEIYDQATRGPWGCLRLLWSLARYDYLAGLGATVAILMLIVDPFTQQLLVFENCDRPVAGGLASIPVTSLWGGLIPGSKLYPGPSRASAPPVWQNAVNVGVYSPGAKTQVSCPSGNCTFPLYNTVGFCSNCLDVSDQLTIQNLTLQLGPNQTYTTWLLNTSLPSGSSITNNPLQSPLNWTTAIVKVSGSIPTVEIILGAVPYDQFRLTFVSDNATCGQREGVDAWRCRGYGAASCQLVPCVKRFNGTVINGTFSETLLETAWDRWGTMLNNYTATYSTIDSNCITSQQRSKLQAAGLDIKPDQKWLPYNATWDESSKVGADALFPQSLQARGCLYSYPWFEYQQLWESYLGKFFGGIQGTANSVQGFPPGPDVATDQFIGPQYLQNIFNYGNITFERIADTFTNISESMTIVVREQGYPNRSDPVVGTATKNQTCLRVQWPWLSFPAVLALMAWIFFARTLFIQYGSHWLPVWKSSTLPMLLKVSLSKHYGDPDVLVKTNGNEELEQVAQHAQVRLSKTVAGVELVDI